MTKRFTVDSDGKYFDRVNRRYVTIDKLFDELNMLHEENIQQKTVIQFERSSHQKYRNEATELQKENEQLKHYKQTVSDVLMSWSNKDLSTNEFMIVHSIMKELGVGDVND